MEQLFTIGMKLTFALIAWAIPIVILSLLVCAVIEVVTHVGGKKK